MTTKTVSKRNPKSESPCRVAIVPQEIAEAAKVALWGEVISWNAGGPQPYAGVIAALKAAGLDDAVARAMLPRHAFARACRKLAQERIIALTEETNSVMRFQFTKAGWNATAGEYEYTKECFLMLCKVTGSIDCPAMPHLATLAKQELDRCQDTRTAGDITGMVQRLFEQESKSFPDLYPIREQGGAYFVPEAKRPFLDQIERFLGLLGGYIRRFPVPKGASKQGDASVRQTVVSGFEDAINGYMQAVAEFTTSTRGSTWEAQLERIREARFKIEALKEYVSDKAQLLDNGLLKVDESLKEKYAAWARCQDADHCVSCDHCHWPQEIAEGVEAVNCVKCGKGFSIEW